MRFKSVVVAVSVVSVDWISEFGGERKSRIAAFIRPHQRHLRYLPENGEMRFINFLPFPRLYLSFILDTKSNTLIVDRSDNRSIENDKKKKY